MKKYQKIFSDEGSVSPIKIEKINHSKKNIIASILFIFNLLYKVVIEVYKGFGLSVLSENQ